MTGSARSIEPVLVLGFNRPAYLARLLERLRLAAPERVYVAIDGPRPSRPGDESAVQRCRDLVREIDWPGEVHTLFQDTNLGCGAGVATAITWFLEAEERGIILEDDILPDPSFFPYCSELLGRYQDDERVFAVSGCNLVPAEQQSHPDEPYRFSQVPHVWGWAAWRRTWRHHRLELGNWHERLDTRTLWECTGRSMTGTLMWGTIFETVSQGHDDGWDAQLVFASMLARQLTATSNVNLTENIGVDDASHVPVTDRGPLPVGSARLPLAPASVACDFPADAWTRTHHLQAVARARQALGLRIPAFRQFVDEVRQLCRDEGEPESLARYSP